MTSYAVLSDAKDLAGLRALFTETATMVIETRDRAPVRWDGVETISDRLAEALRGGRTLHMMCNIRIEASDSTGIRAASDLLLLALGDDGRPTLQTTATYYDEIVQRGDQLVFQQRRVHVG